LSRMTGKLIADSGLGRVEGITRHQLFVHPDIPYTSKNSSACLYIETDNEGELIKECREFLLKNSADGSDAGLCLCREEFAGEEIVEWGRKAKKEVLTKQDAYSLAKRSGIYLEGLTGTKDGVIGALAAVGLRKGGNDGRFIWLKGKELRELRGVMSVRELTGITGIERVQTKDGEAPGNNDIIDPGDWIRPVLIDNKAVLIIEKSDHEECKWKCVSKDYTKSISD